MTHRHFDSGALLDSPTYSPNVLLNYLMSVMRYKNDSALALALDVPPALISKARNKRIPMSAGVLLRMHEITGMNIRAMREMMGDPTTMPDEIDLMAKK